MEYGITMTPKKTIIYKRYHINVALPVRINIFTGKRVVLRIVFRKRLCEPKNKSRVMSITYKFPKNHAGRNVVFFLLSVMRENVINV